MVGVPILHPSQGSAGGGRHGFSPPGLCTRYTKHAIEPFGTMRTTWRLSGTLIAMLNLILATEAATEAPPGDDLATLAYALLGIAVLVAVIATVIITPRAKSHD